MNCCVCLLSYNMAHDFRPWRLSSVLCTFVQGAVLAAFSWFFALDFPVRSWQLSLVINFLNQTPHGVRSGILTYAYKCRLHMNNRELLYSKVHCSGREKEIFVILLFSMLEHVAELERQLTNQKVRLNLSLRQSLRRTNNSVVIRGKGWWVMFVHRYAVILIAIWHWAPYAWFLEELV